MNLSRCAYLDVLPYYSLSNCDLSLELFGSRNYCDVEENSPIKKLVKSNDYLNNMEFDYFTGLQCKSLSNRVINQLGLCLFHVNVRSLNANYRKLIEFLTASELNFDVIVLSEIWNVNLNWFANLFVGYEFLYNVPCSSKCGGVAMFVKSSLCPTVRHDLSCVNSNCESLWVIVYFSNVNYAIGGFYRHPNTPISEFIVSCYNQSS